VPYTTLFRSGQIVELGGEHARIHDHRVLGVEQDDRVHPVRPALPNPDAALELGPRGAGGNSRSCGHGYWFGAVMRPATISARSESTLALAASGISALLRSS